MYLAIDHDAASLQVWLELAFSRVHRVASVMPELRLRAVAEIQRGSDLLF